MRYDTIVIGAGIAGICAAYWLKEAGQKVLLVDKKGLLAGASGAAGAFLSPRLGKGGALQLLTNEAYRFALGFYAQKAPEAFFQKGVARIPKDEPDAERFESYKKHLDIPFDLCEAKELSFIDEDALKFGALCFGNAAFVDPAGVAKRLTEGIDTALSLAAAPSKERGGWRVGRFLSENIVLATGSEKLPVEIPYIEIGGVWGERVDLKSEAEIPMSLHRQISVSANIDGTVRVGATHVRGGTESEIERINGLIVQAIELVPSLKDQTLSRIYAGRRSAVSDHFPLVGAVADLNETARRLKTPHRSIKPESEEIVAKDGCYIAGCFGGRGFVFAPLMGKMLSEKILGRRRVDISVSPDRYLLRYLRKTT
ncbi:FAD dependent oxidoreductase [Hydrogenimonas sp.]|nr:FAD dependent oxidoreductase [Hydrogenimonas sp.]